MKRLLPVLAIGALTLAGCANTAPYGGNVYTGSQAGAAQSVTFGTIEALRQVQIQADSRAGGIVGTGGGAVVGGDQTLSVRSGDDQVTVAVVVEVAKGQDRARRPSRGTVGQDQRPAAFFE